jgi:hypothetical protein
MVKAAPDACTPVFPPAGASAWGQHPRHLPTDVARANTPNPFVPAETEAMRTIETPVVLTGRLADPASPDEAVVTPAFVRSTGRGVGDTVTARLTTSAQASASLDGGADTSPAGPAVRLSIVGVVRSLWYGDDVGGRDIAILRALG